MTSTTGRPERRADELLADWADLVGRARRPRTAPRGAGHGWVGPLRQAAGVGMAAVLLVAGTAWLLPRSSGGNLSVGASPSPGTCPVTRSDGRDWYGAGEPPTGAYGAEGLVVPVMPDGTIRVSLAQVDADGVLWDKLGVWRDPQASGSLTLAGRRLDGEAPPMIADIPAGYGETGLQMTSVGFPAEGCWEITARSGDAELRWVVRVERASLDDPGGCPVTMPDGVHTDAWPATALDHGADGIVTALAPGGVVLISGGSGDGAIGWRDTLFAIAEPARGPLTVTGHLLTVDPAAGDVTSSPGIGPESLQVAYPDGQSGDGPLRVDLGFPTEGCWEITARAGEATLTYVTWVELGVVSPGTPVASPAVATGPVPSGP